ncbi:MAG: class III poly(R)-hydroxyalkanoic acid synthase subunit PhaC [Myxococcota bacterium]
MFTEESQKAFLEEITKFQERLHKSLLMLSQPIDTSVAKTPYEVVYSNNKMRLLYYRSPAKKVSPDPLVGVYALVNRQYMLDLQPDRSMLRQILEGGYDVYMIDWGYPTPKDRYLTMEDYIDGYINEVVDFVRERTGKDKITIVSICQGGTFSAIYTALYPEKIKNLVTMVAPFDFDTRDGLLNVWSKALNPDRVVDVLGNVPGDFMNIGFLMLNPFRLMFDKYVGLLENIDDIDAISNFIRMEKWIFDSPDQAGEAWKKFMKDCYLENKLIKGEMEIGGRKVNLKNITVPVLNIYAEKDHLVPPASTIPFCKYIGSKDTDTFSLPTGHIGIFVGGKSQNVLVPHILQWLGRRTAPPQKRNS